MPNSMTGFGKAVVSDEITKVTVEVKSVNSRYLELINKLPRQLIYFEDSARKLVNSKIRRGRVELFLQIESKDIEQNYIIDDYKIKSYKKIFEKVSENTGIPNDMKLSDYLDLPEVIVKNSDFSEDTEMLVKKAITQALDNLCSMRNKEGVKIIIDLKQRVVMLEELIKKLEDYTNDMIEFIFEKLQKRISELLEKQNIAIEESRLISESAIYADKMNITEEIVRFKSHIEQLMGFLDVDDKEIGKKIDFLMQEMNREINTIGSKSQKSEIISLVVEIKSELENIREQIQNIE